MDESRKVPFPDEGVEFIFPPRLVEDVDVGVIKRELAYHKGKDGFHPRRHVIRFMIYDKEKEVELTDFRRWGGFEIAAKFKKSDLDAQNKEDPKDALSKIDLGYYEEKKGDNIWVSCKENHEYTQLPIMDPDLDKPWVGYATVRIDKLPDPEMAWGP